MGFPARAPLELAHRRLSIPRRGRALAKPAGGAIYHPPGWWEDGVNANVQELRLRATDTEKITINLGFVDLGQIDLLVQEGFYSNRTDFIRTAIRNQLERHAEVVRQSIARKTLDLGLRHYSRGDLEEARKAGQILRINVVGLAS